MQVFNCVVIFFFIVNNIYTLWWKIILKNINSKSNFNSDNSNNKINNNNNSYLPVILRRIIYLTLEVLEKVDGDSGWDNWQLTAVVAETVDSGGVWRTE